MHSRRRLRSRGGRGGRGADCPRRPLHRPDSSGDGSLPRRRNESLARREHGESTARREGSRGWLSREDESAQRKGWLPSPSLRHARNRRGSAAAIGRAALEGRGPRRVKDHVHTPPRETPCSRAGKSVKSAEAASTPTPFPPPVHVSPRPRPPPRSPPLLPALAFALSSSFFVRVPFAL